jgi:hypothetical protein
MHIQLYVLANVCGPQYVKTKTPACQRLSGDGLKCNVQLAGFAAGGSALKRGKPLLTTPSGTRQTMLYHLLGQDYGVVHRLETWEGPLISSCPCTKSGVRHIKTNKFKCCA